VDPTNAAWGNDEAKAWLSTALGEIDRGIAILKRARQQLTSRRGVTLTAETPLSAQPIAIPSTFLSDFISEILTVAGGIESKLEVTLNAPAGATPAAVQALVATIGAARVAKRSHPLAWKRAPQHDVIEMGLDLCQQRDARYVLDRELSLIPEITFVKVPLAPAIWREADIENRTVRHYLDAMLAISSEHHVATGYGDIPSLVERKTWLVHKKVVPANGAEWNAPVAVAVPPLSTRPFGADLRDVKRFVEPPGGGAPTVELRQVSIRDADIDALAAEAYRRIDGALSAEVVASLTKDERSLVRDLLKSKEVIAGSIARSVTPVLQNVPEPAKNRMDNLHAGLADRFKRRLAGIYEIDTVLYYGDTHPSASLGSLCRQLHGTIEPDEPGAKPQALSGAVFEAFNLPVQSDDETAPSKRVTRDLVVSADAPPKLAGLLHLPKWYKITHLQRLGRQTVSSAGVGETGRYRPTAWLTLYATDNRFRINLPGGGTKGLPIVVRELPNRPALETDGWEAEPISGSDQKERLASARRWRAWRDWRQDGQKETGDSPDFLTVTLTYSAAGGMSAMAEDTSDKFAAYRLGIATFVRATDEAWDQLVKPDSPVRRHAFRYLSERATELAATLTQPRDFAAAANTTDKDTLELHEVERIEKPTRIKAKITGAKFDPSVELRLYARGKDGKLDSETSKRVPLKQGSDSVSLDLDAVKEGPGEKRRRLEASRLDIFKRNSAMIELLLVRNKYFDRPDDPGKMDVAESFVYRLPAVTSPQPQRPYLDRTSQRIDCEALSVAKLDDGIKKFLIDLLQGDGQIVQGLRVDVLAEFVPDIFKYGGRGAPIPARSFKTSDPQADAKLLSKPIADWLARERPARRKDGELRGQLRLDLRFYDDSGRPILRLADCRFPLVP
jgi:hypothetical protein